MIVRVWHQGLSDQEDEDYSTMEQRIKDTKVLAQAVKHFEKFFTSEVTETDQDRC